MAASEQPALYSSEEVRARMDEYQQRMTDTVKALRDWHVMAQTNSILPNNDQSHEGLLADEAAFLKLKAETQRLVKAWNPPQVVPEVLYFGCRGAKNPGHYLQSRKSSPNIYTDTPWGIKLDGCLVAGLPDNPDGKWQIHRFNGWTALAFWDRSGDSRPGSHSAFLTNAIISDEAIFSLARSQWPEVFKRPGFPIK